ERNQIDATPLISACSSGQFRIAESLIAAGADVFAHDRFGMTAGLLAWNSRVAEKSVEGAARERVIAQMRAQGFPFPPPSAEDVREALARGAWPPVKGTAS
ncbi:MAG TPA: ankyrin repeat domain-containing protein, partial [Novosphingobium sp.]|nr:ankyrin repeat domain-containing protein [Novosphingobium sp.]